MQTVIGAFDDRARAQQAVERLVQEGFQRDDIHLERQDQPSGATSQAQVSGEHHPGFFARLFGLDEDDRQARYADTYDEFVSRGSSVVVVDARDEQQAERAVTCLHELGAVDVDERARQWRAQGWTGGQPAQGAGTGDLAAGKEGVMDVVQEELQVGKRSLDKGGVRVIQRVTEKPIREVVRLREEHVSVDRRPVDRPAEADVAAFKEGTVEVRETAEEPVVAKRARVVEEVRVSKDVREREQAVEDTVRRKDVDVERLAEGGRPGSVERERAVAADKERDVEVPRSDKSRGSERE